MDSFTECFCNFDKDTSEKQVIVLMPDYGFLIWKLPTEVELKNFPLKDLSPFHLFKEQYVKAMNEYSKTVQNQIKMTRRSLMFGNLPTYKFTKGIKKFVSPSNRF